MGDVSGSGSVVDIAMLTNVVSDSECNERERLGKRGKFVIEQV